MGTGKLPDTLVILNTLEIIITRKFIPFKQQKSTDIIQLSHHYIATSKYQASLNNSDETTNSVSMSAVSYQLSTVLYCTIGKPCFKVCDK